MFWAANKIELIPKKSIFVAENVSWQYLVFPDTKVPRFPGFLERLKQQLPILRRPNARTRINTTIPNI